MRLFVAVDPGERIRREVEAALARVRRRAPDARWARPEQMHLTLAFLGSVEPERLAAVIRAVEEGARGHAAFPLRVRGCGVFGGSSRPRVLWAGVEAPALLPLQADVEARLRDAAFDVEERAFRPHLTLARARDRHGDRALPAAARDLAGLDAGAATIREVRVMESHLSPEGSRHEVRAAVPL